MLEKWEKEGVSFLLGDSKQGLIAAGKSDSDVLDLSQSVKIPSKAERGGNQYDTLFD